MRSLLRNQRTVWFSHLVGTGYVEDDDGNETSEQYEKWSEPEMLRCNISGASGQWSPESFGGPFAGYNRTISLTGACPLEIGDRLWVEREPPERANYVVTGVNRGLNSHLIAVKEVPVNAAGA